MGDPSVSSSPSLADLPLDELAAYGRELGLAVDPHTPRGELLRLIRERHELLLELDREAMLDVVVWARTPVRRSAGKEELAKHIAGITGLGFDGLSDHGLKTLARLRGVTFGSRDSRSTIERRLRRQGGFWARVQRKRRSVVGTWISRVVESTKGDGDYQFLPESAPGQSLKETIEDVGVVGGIAQKLRGAADQYVHEKLDEIETRIDRKLDEIDRRLSEWRDREITNRLRIIKITLITAIVVAIISLGYDYVKSRDHPTAPVSGSVVGGQETGSSP
jgi:hypothetical protein